MPVIFENLWESSTTFENLRESLRILPKFRLGNAAALNPSELQANKQTNKQTNKRKSTNNFQASPSIPKGSRQILKKKWTLNLHDTIGTEFIANCNWCNQNQPTQRQLIQTIRILRNKSFNYCWLVSLIQFSRCVWNVSGRVPVNDSTVPFISLQFDCCLFSGSLATLGRI